MNKKHATLMRSWVLGLILAALVAGFLIANVNSFTISLIYLALFLVVVSAGMLTSPWGGLVASGIAVFALILLNQYIGVNPGQNRVVNIASEMTVFLLAGPLAGWFSGILDKHQAQIHHWLTTIEEQSMRDPLFHTLKPEWGRVRLEEELLRARTYARPITVAVLKFAEADSAGRRERISAMQALIRIVHSATSAPAVVSYFGENRLLLILPEYNPQQAQDLLTVIRQRAASEMYFPQVEQTLGQPLSAFGELQVSSASPAPGMDSVDSLLQQAAAGL